MKKLLLAVCVMFGSATLVSAQQTDQSTQPGQTQSSQDKDQDKQQISVSELPEEVTAKLESQDYSGWTIGNAYKKSAASDNNMEVYIVELKKGTETKKVKFDRDGNKLEKDGAHSDKQYRQDGQQEDQGQADEQGQAEADEQGQADEQSAEQVDDQQ